MSDISNTAVGIGFFREGPSITLKEIKIVGTPDPVRDLTFFITGATSGPLSPYSFVLVVEADGYEVARRDLPRPDNMGRIRVSRVGLPRSGGTIAILGLQKRGENIEGQVVGRCVYTLGVHAPSNVLMFSINAVKGVQFGSGFDAAAMRGSPCERLPATMSRAARAWTASTMPFAERNGDPRHRTRSASRSALTARACCD